MTGLLFKSNSADEVVMLLRCWFFKHPGNIYLLKVNNRNTRKRCQIRSKSTIKAQERSYCRHYCVFIVNFAHISQLFLVFLLLTLNVKVTWEAFLQNACESLFRTLMLAVLAGNCMFQVNNKDSRTTSEASFTGAFIVNFEHVSQLVLVSLLLTLIR